MRKYLVILVTCVIAGVGYAQAPKNTQRFEVATIKRVQSDGRNGDIRPAPGGARLVGTNISLKALLAAAYRTRPELISGGPGWVTTELYEVNAKAERPSSFEELTMLLRNLLADRFKVGFHTEMKEHSIYGLVVDNETRVKTHQSQGDDNPVDQPSEKTFLHVQWNIKSISMNHLAWRLSQIVDRPVVNQTKLLGIYDFDFAFTKIPSLNIPPGAQMNGQPIDTSGLNIFDVLKREGLRLVAEKGPVATLVIDRADRPGEN